MDSREAAEAISEGINWLSFIAGDPGPDAFASSRSSISKALVELTTALATVRQADVWTSRTFDPDLEQEVGFLSQQLGHRLPGAIVLAECAELARGILDRLGVPDPRRATRGAPDD